MLCRGLVWLGWELLLNEQWPVKKERAVSKLTA